VKITAKSEAASPYLAVTTRILLIGKRSGIRIKVVVERSVGLGLKEIGIMNLGLPFELQRKSRKPMMLLVTLVIGVFAVRECADLVISNDIPGMAYAVMICAAAAIIVAILNNWRNGVYFFLAWLLFEDFARKFLGNNMAIYFAKDFLLLVVYISFYVDYRRHKLKLFRVPFRVPLLLLVWLGTLQVFNPASTSIFYGLMGFKMFFYYVPLLFVGYALFNSEVEVRRFFTANLKLALVIVSVGIAQSIVGPTFLNPAHQADDLRQLSTLYRVAPESGAIAYRPTSVFVSAGRYADFMMVAWLLVLGFSGYLLIRQRKGRLFAFLIVALTAAGAFLSASRGTFMWTTINAVATSIAFVWGAPWRQGEALRAFRAIQRAVLAAGLGIVLVCLTYPDAILSRLAIYQETLGGGSNSELGHRTWDYPISNFLGAFDSDRWGIGYGIGTTALGSQYVARFFHVTPPTVGVESGFGALVVEMGVVGLILWIVMGIAITFAAFKVVKKLRGSPLFPIAFAIFWYSFILLLPATFAGIQAYEDFLLNAYLWLMLGILFRLPTLKLAAVTDVADAGKARKMQRSSFLNLRPRPILVQTDVAAEQLASHKLPSA
jgi:hypothetical protein